MRSLKRLLPLIFDGTPGPDGMRRAKVLGVAAVVFLWLFLLAVGAFDYYARLRQGAAMAAGQAQLLADHAANALDAVDTELTDLADQVAAEWTANGASGTWRTPAFGPLLELPQVRGAALLSWNGAVLAHSQGAPMDDVDPQERDFVRAHSTAFDVGTYLAEPAADEASGSSADWGVVASRRVPGPDGGSLAILVAQLSPGYFAGVYNAAAAPADLEVALVGRGGVTLAGGVRPGQLAAQTVLSGMNTTLPVGRWPASITATADGRAILARMAPLIELLALGGLIGTLAIGLGAIAGLRTSSRRRRAEEKAQAQAAESAQRGDALDTQVKVVARGARELGVIRAELQTVRGTAERQTRARSEFLSHMSHELRTPLNAILGFSEIMKERVPGLDNLDTLVGYSRHIHESASHLLDLINDILDLSKVEGGRFSLAEEKVDLRYVVTSTVRMLTPMAEERGVTVETGISAATPLLMADPRLIRQMLLNLVSNALKFTPAGGAVMITSRRRNGGVLLSVRDTGVGIPPEDMARVLEPFGQAPTHPRSSAERGSGLGLPLVKSFIEVHDGTFDLRSAPGKGTAVGLWFPPERVVKAAVNAVG